MRAVYTVIPGRLDHPTACPVTLCRVTLSVWLDTHPLRRACDRETATQLSVELILPVRASLPARSMRPSM
jgi:hypothetical protein